MNIFWDNISRFPRFVISVFIGFFLTTVNPVFRLLTNEKTNYLISALLIVFSLSLYVILKLMLGYTYE
uniref:hypothetical protein n=1 Tax=Rhodochorton tenue TaxID=173034 RepID=UPI002A83D272|nr:hypothetical protein UYM82_pgp145 [Rhodochorton tenue]WOK79430.1 hypothetical protein [Rhodochorton tenue]